VEVPVGRVPVHVGSRQSGWVGGGGVKGGPSREDPSGEHASRKSQ